MTHFEKECKRTCAWCAEGLELSVTYRGQRVHVRFDDEGEPLDLDCAAPSERDFAESQAIRAEEAERKLADTEQLFESYRINAAHAAKLDREALEQERDSLKAQMDGAVVCGKCDGRGWCNSALISCPACKAGIVWPQEVKGS